MVLEHVKCGQGQKALELFEQMQQEGVCPDAVTFVGVANPSASLVAGCVPARLMPHTSISYNRCELLVILTRQ
jgi:pentatricopeptide repeat protein